jgi:N-acetylmuramoyl-L-alanine amidase
MYWRHLQVDVGWTLSQWRRSLRFFWYRTNKAVWVFVVFVALVLAVLGSALEAVVGYREEQGKRAREFHAKNLDCLARNVYFEARGEPLAGQFAVAEVTMNRRASRLFPKTVCEVVYQQNWDPLRRRHVGAFSWTEFKTLPEPDGDAWHGAKAVAAAVYYRKHKPVLQGALFFHAVHIKPEWAREKQRIGRIGKHIFYR